MKFEDNILEEFEPKKSQKHLLYNLVVLLFLLSIIIAITLAYVNLRSIGIEPSNTGENSSYKYFLLFLVITLVLFLFKRKLGWILLAIISIAFAILIFKFAYRAIQGEYTFKEYFFSRATYFLLTYISLSILLFTNPITNYLKISNVTKFITLLFAIIFSSLLLLVN